MTITYIYQWATIGGVERVIINRALALKSLGNQDYKFKVLYLEDAGGLEAFKKFINIYDLNEIIVKVDILNKDLLNDNSLYSVIDTPKGIEILNKYDKQYFIECHTSYTENRQYLKHLNTHTLITVPSEHFRDIIIKEAPHIKNILVLNTPIHIQKPHKKIEFPKYKGRLLAYLGRMDELKNFTYILDAFEELVYDFHKHNFYLLLVGPYSVEYNIYEELSKRKILNKTILIPPIDFDKVDYLLEALQKENAIAISASKAESFGMSVAETILHDVPILLSDITAHQYLVQNNQECLFSLNDSTNLTTKIINVDLNFQMYNNLLSSKIKPFIQKISSDQIFMKDFKKILETLHEQ